MSAVPRIICVGCQEGQQIEPGGGGFEVAFTL